MTISAGYPGCQIRCYPWHTNCVVAASRPSQMPGPSAPPLQSQAGFEQALQDLEERLQAQMTAREGQTVLIGTWEAFAKRGRKHGKCAVCQRAFHGEEELHT